VIEEQARVYLLSTLTNLVTATELDPAFEPFLWNDPSDAVDWLV